MIDLAKKLKITNPNMVKRWSYGYAPNKSNPTILPEMTLPSATLNLSPTCNKETIIPVNIIFHHKSLKLKGKRGKEKKNFREICLKLLLLLLLLLLCSPPPLVRSRFRLFRSAISRTLSTIQKWSASSIRR